MRRLESEQPTGTDKSFAMQDGILTLRGRAAWAHDFNSDRNIAATFQTCRARPSLSTVPHRRVTLLSSPHPVK